MENINFFLPVIKPQGISSFKFLNLFKKLFGWKKVGHGGTLDPFAEGLLIFLLGRYTRFFPILQTFPKTYKGSVVLGRATDTLDITGKIVEEKKVKIEDKEVFLKEISDIIETKFLGKIEQIPPMSSALKYKGKPLYDYFRKGESLSLANIKRRKVKVEKLIVGNLRQEKGEYICDFETEVSSGTYVRTLLYDLFQEVGIPVFMNRLCRTNIGPFSWENAITYRDNLSEEDLKKHIVFLEDIFAVGMGIIKDGALKKAIHGNYLSLEDVSLEKKGGYSYYLFFDVHKKHKIGYYQKKGKQYKVILLEKNDH